MIILINGVAEAGKDKFVSYCQDYSKSPINNTSFIDTTKAMAKESFGWDGGKTDKDRKLLSDLEDIRIEYNNAPFDDIVDKVRWLRICSKDCIIFIHVRKPKEIDKLKKYFNDKYYDKCIALLIDSNKDAPDNKADRGVYDYEYDMIIDNNGSLDDLKESAKLFIEDII